MASASACACAVCDISIITAYLRARVPALRSAATSPEIAVVCGSGLSRLSDLIEDPVHVPYADIPRFPQATVAGHGTELVFGTLGGRRVVAQKGRFHYYEGHSMQRVAVPVRVFAALGCRVMLATNAAGGVNADYRVGDIMVIKDHVSLPCLGGAHPLTGPNDERLGPRFPPMTAAYAPSLQALAAHVAGKRGLSDCLRSGVYFHDSGPTYETPHEIRAMRLLGGDAVGMSTVPEVIAAAHAGMAVLGLSLITNQCRAPGDTGVAPSHQEVLDATVARTEAMQGLVQEICSSIPVADFPQAPVAALFEAGRKPPACEAPRHAGSAAPPGQLSQLAAAALVGGVVGAVAAAAVTALLAKAGGKK